MRIRRVIIAVVIASIVTPFVIVGVSAAIVAAGARGRTHSSSAPITAEPVAIVFGAGIRPNGVLSLMLKDRLDAAITLYQEKKAPKLLLTGDHGTDDYDEVDAMADYLISKGIPAGDITLDHAGFNTYDSCYRANRIFGIKRAVLVTQEFHMPRALYICKKLGVSGSGFAQPDWSRYPQLRSEYSSREALAKVKAVWQTNVTKPSPKYLGKYEGLNGEPPKP